MRAVADRPLPAPVPAGLAVRRLHQVHGTEVVAADGPDADGGGLWARGPGGAPPEGDAVVASSMGVALVVLTADCAPVALGSPEGVHAAVHAGWRGLGAGVLQRAVEAVRARGASAVVGALGPCIGACCYEFPADGAAALSAACGTDVVGTTTWGSASVDLPAAVGAVLARAGVPLVHVAGACTACTPGYFSHRGHGDAERQALFVWRDR
jgi:YfiH family protein